jgi:uncharacterized protein
MASSPQHEPTMEEILASIRKIISEDSSEAAPSAPAAPAPAATAAAAPAAPEEPDVLELTQEVEEPPPPPRPEPVHAVAPPPPGSEPDVEFKMIEETAAPAAAIESDDIFSDRTRRALDETFAKIPEAVAPTAPAPIASPRSMSLPEGNSVEAVFERAVAGAFDPVLHKWMDGNKADLLAAVKPLIREWMDEHFPALLEGAVRNEVERVVKARGGK